MSLPEIVTPRASGAPRAIALLEKEKAMTRARDELSAERRRLPMVEITKDYRFEGPQGEVGLLDLFEGRLQLIVGHFMFHPEWEDGCPSCSAGADEVADGLREHLARPRHHARLRLARAAGEDRALQGQEGLDVPVVLVARQRLQLRLRRHARLRREADGVQLPRRAGRRGQESEQPFDMPGTSCFLRDGDRVFHTYSSYARGAEWTGGSYAFLDLTALGRQEDWEEPEGRAEHARGNSPDFAS